MNIIGQQIVLIAVMFDGSGITVLNNNPSLANSRIIRNSPKSLCRGRMRETAGAKTIAASMVSNV